MNQIPIPIAREAANLHWLRLNLYEKSRPHCYLMSYPRSGNSWLRNMLTLNHNAYYGGSIYSLDKDSFIPDMHEATFDQLSQIGSKNHSKLIIKTHWSSKVLQLYFGEDFLGITKNLCIFRNPFDSIYSFHKLLSNTPMLTSPSKRNLDFQDFFQLELREWSRYVCEQSSNASSSNVFHVIYEDIVRNTSFWLEKICNFFDLKYTKDSINEAVSKTAMSGASKFKGGYPRGKTGHAVLHINNHIKKETLTYLEEVLEPKLFQETVLKYIK